MTTKQPRTRTAQIRCQPCHYDQILKVAIMERDRLEAIKAESMLDRAEIREGLFFKEMNEIIYSDVPYIMKTHWYSRIGIVNYIEKKIIERGV